MFFLRIPSADRLNELWTQARNASFSYDEVGATSADASPAGYHDDRHSVSLGAGSDCFGRAVAALKGWQVHTRSGIRIFPEGQDLAPDVTVLSVVRAGPLATVAPCRVIYVVDEADRFGFAYGTLPGHPEKGEESFIVEKSADGAVRFILRAFSRPNDLLTRLGGPIARQVQQRATTAYLEAMKELAAGAA